MAQVLFVWESLAATSISLSWSEVTVPRVCNVNPTRRICRNELDSDGFCLDGTFVPEDVHVIATRIYKRHSCFVHMWFAVWIVPFITRHRSCRDDDQAMPRVRVPACASARLPDIALHVHI